MVFQKSIIWRHEFNQIEAVPSLPLAVAAMRTSGRIARGKARQGPRRAARTVGTGRAVSNDVAR